MIDPSPPNRLTPPITTAVTVALEDVVHPERRDERREAEVVAHPAVERPHGEPAADRREYGARDAAVVAVHDHCGKHAADRRDRADGEVDAAADDHEELRS